MKAIEESQIRKLWKTMHKDVLVDFQKINWLFLRFNQLFLSAFNKNNLKQIYVRSGKERITQTDLYWFTRKPRATSSPQKTTGYLLCNQNLDYKQPHQRSDLEHLKHTHTHFSWQSHHRTQNNL